MRDSNTELNDHILTTQKNQGFYLDFHEIKFRTY